MQGSNTVMIAEEKTRDVQIITAVYFCTPFLFLILVAGLLVQGKIQVFDVVVMAVSYVLTGLGITFMNHRYYTHKSFALPVWLRIFWTACSSMALEASTNSWVATHIKHHKHSDLEDDPHSPHHFGKGLWNTIKGFFWAHTGWMIKGVPVENMYLPKRVAEDPVAAWFTKTYPLWIIASYTIPTALGWWHRGPEGAWVGLCLAFVRVGLIYNVTWSVNSLGHTVGQRPFNTTEADMSRDLPFVYPIREWLNPVKLVLSVMGYTLAILSFGELYHNGHHQFAWSAKHAVAYRRHVDVTWYVIRLHEKLGLAKDVRLPSASVIDAARAE